MKWRAGQFKGKEIWVGVDDAGVPVEKGGRTPIRYSSKEGARIYRAGARRVQVDQASTIEDLDAGITADEAKKRKRAKRGSGFGSAGSRSKRQAALALDAARELIDGLDDDVVKAFTDGACRGNPGPAGSGAVVILPDGRQGEASRSLGRATNNVGELVAVDLALDLLEGAEVDRDTAVALFTDSSYTNGVLTRGWKAKANREVIVPLRERLEAWPNLEIHWVAGHVGLEHNERADTLANRGVSGVTDQRWA